MTDDRHLTFLQRMGDEEVPQPMKLGELSGGLRRELWNTVRRFLQSYRGFDAIGRYFYSRDIIPLIERVVGKMLDKTEDEVNESYNTINIFIKKILCEAKANLALQFIEHLINDPLVTKELHKQLSDLFEEHRAPYYLDFEKKTYRIFPRTSKEESDATRKSLEKLQEGGFEGALSHVRQAAEHINGGQFSDAIHDSISAVESVARAINKAKTLKEALEQLEGTGMIKHKAFKDAIIKLYAYTSDEEGIRHALIDVKEADVGLSDALFFYNACAAFAGYLATVGKVR